MLLIFQRAGIRVRDYAIVVLKDLWSDYFLLQRATLYQRVIVSSSAPIAANYTSHKLLSILG